MSRTAFTQCGFVLGGDLSQADIDQLKGWYWPFPAILTPAPIVGLYPITVTPRLLHTIYWRIQRYQVTGSVTLTGGGYPGTPNPIDFIIDQPLAMHEKFLEVYGALAPRYAAIGSQSTAFAECLATLLPQNSVADLAHAIFDFAMQLQVTAFCSNIRPSLFRSTAFDASFLGIPIPMYESDGASDPVVTGSLTITPLRWWEYDNGTGPIYDANTGVELITPVPRGL